MYATEFGNQSCWLFHGRAQSLCIRHRRIKFERGGALVKISNLSTMVSTKRVLHRDS